VAKVKVNQTPESESEVVYPEKEVVYVHRAPDSPTAAGVNLILVLIALVILVGLVALMFYGLPHWFGTSTVNVNIRTQ
jgi:hypothetical protein